MANNPVNNIDPNGGYMVTSDEGIAQRNKFVQKWQEYVISDKGQAFIRQNYLRDYETLAKKWLRYADDLNQKSGGEFLKALLRLNNDYLGMGLSAIYLASGSDRLTGAAILKNKNLFHTLQEMNGEAQRVEDAQKVVDDYHRPLNSIDAAEQEFMNNNQRRQREYVNEWKTGEQAAFIAALQGLMDVINAPKDLDNPSFMNPGQQTNDMPLAVTTYTDPPGGKSVKNGIKDNKWRKQPRKNNSGFGNKKDGKYHSKNTHGLSIGIKFGLTNPDRVYIDIRLHSNYNHFVNGYRGTELWKFKIYFRDNVNGTYK